MKKLFPLALICLVLLSVLFACTDKNKVDLDGKTVYDIDVYLDGQVLSAKQTVKVTNTFQEGLDSLTFALYPNAYSEDASSRAYTGRLARYGGITVSKLTVNDTETEFTLSDNNLYMSFNVPAMTDKQEVVVGMEYTVQIPECSLRFGELNGAYNLSNFYPQLAVWSGEEFLTDPFSTIGDPVMSDVADFKLSVDIPASLVAAIPGSVSSGNAKPGRKMYEISAPNVRDFAMALNGEYQVATAKAGDVEVSYYYVEDGSAQAHADLAASAIEVFSENFGSYPYDRFVVALTPFDADGMEFSGLVYISDDASDAEAAIIHEAAHQWWYNLVGNDNVRSPWLDEGLTSFTSAYYYKLVGNEDKYNAEMALTEQSYLRYERLQKLRKEGGLVAINKSIYEYTSYQYGMLVYDKGAMMFKHILETVGEEKFLSAMRDYVENNRFARVGAEELSASFGKVMKCDASGLINGWLSESACLAAFAS